MIPAPISAPISTPVSAPIAWADEARELAFRKWIGGVQATRGLDLSSLRSASSDASFRRYFRVDAAGGRSLIVMDAPPPQEDVRPFIQVAGLLHAAGLNATEIVEQDVVHGFLLLTDLGSRL